MSRRKKAAIVDVAGPANIQTIAEIHQELLRGLQQNSAVELLLGRAADIDLTFVQLVESARRFAAAENKTVALSEPATPDFREILQRGGFLAAAADRTFWLHEAGDH